MYVIQPYSKKLSRSPGRQARQRNRHKKRERDRSRWLQGRWWCAEQWRRSIRDHQSLRERGGDDWGECERDFCSESCQSSSYLQISEDGGKGWSRALLSTTPQHLLQEAHISLVWSRAPSLYAVLHTSAHCGSQPARHHLSLPLQAEINFPALNFFYLKKN